MAPALAGRLRAEARDEIVLGTQTLRAADARVGDDVRVLVGNESRQFRVVGRAVFPDVGDIGQLGRGAYLTFDAVDGVGGAAPRNVVLVKFESDADRSAGVASLTRAIAPIPVTSAALPPRPRQLRPGRRPSDRGRRHPRGDGRRGARLHVAHRDPAPPARSRGP